MKNNSVLMVSLLVGAAAGTALALFLTSDKGREMMEDVKDAAEKAEDEVKGTFSNLQDKVEKGMDLFASLEKRYGKLFKTFIR